MPTPDRTRSLAQIEELLEAAGGVEPAIVALVERRAPIDVLEVGFGHGRALLELAWRLRDRDVTFRGVDLGYKSPLQSRADLRAVAREYRIVPPADLHGFVLPLVEFADATTLGYGDETLDLVFSAVTIRFMRDKARHIEEVCRVLRPGGRAILHIGEANWDYPWGSVTGDRRLTPYTSRMVLKHGDELVPLGDYLALFAGDVFGFALTPATRCILIVDKQRSGTLSLGLAYDEALSMNGRKVPLCNRHGEVRGGFRTVYEVGDAAYARLAAAREAALRDAG